MIVGIDLGTTKSVVCVWQNGMPRIIPSESGHNSIPSVVLATPKGGIYAGESALRHRDRYAGMSITISSVKRMMGKQGETGWEWWKTYPQEISAFILSELKHMAAKHLGEGVDQAVIAIPSHFDESQRRATKEAAEIAGLEATRLLNEATAAAVTYGYSRGCPGKILVFDLGGGTLDISIVDSGDNVFEVLCIEGEDRLGGDDFDEVIVNHILREVEDKHQVKIELDPLRQLMLKEVAERAKIDLSTADKTTIRIPGFWEVPGESKDLDLCLERSQFEELSQSLFDRAGDLLSRALKSVGLNGPELDAVLLLGGSSRIPHIRTLVQKVVGKVPFTGVDPETCVAQGAAMVAAGLRGELKDVLILDAIGSSYGTATSGGLCTRMIEKNTTVPTTKKAFFTTTEDNQSTITVAVYQGEGEFVKDNTFLGTLELSGIVPAPKGVPQVEVTFEVDADMIMSVSAKDVGTGRQAHAIIRSPFGLNDTRLRRARQEVESWLYDREWRESVDSLTSRARDLVSTGTDVLTCDDMGALKEYIILLTGLLENRASPEELSETIAGARSLCDRTETTLREYQKRVQSLKSLAAGIAKMAPLLMASNKDKAELLLQGRMLMEDWLQRRTDISQCEKMCLAIRLEYVRAKIELIKQALHSLEESGLVAQVVGRIEGDRLDPSKMAATLSGLRKIDGVSDILNLLEPEETDGFEEIRHSLLGELVCGSSLWALMILIVSVFIDSEVLSHLSEVGDDEAGGLLKAALFGALHKARDPNHRRMAARGIARYLSGKRHVEDVVHCLCAETDSAVRQHLWSYVDRQEPGTLQRLFAGASPATRRKMEEDKELLLRLAREPDERTCVLALRSLSKFWDSDVKELALSLIRTGSSNVQRAVLTVAAGHVQSDPPASELLTEALRDRSPETRAYALNLSADSKEPSLHELVCSAVLSETNVDVKYQAVRALGKLASARAIETLWRLALSVEPKIRNAAISMLEEKGDATNKDFARLLSIVRRKLADGLPLKFTDSLFLRRYCRRYPDMGYVARRVRQWPR
jgi:molecular chaperone DnaK